MAIVNITTNGIEINSPFIPKEQEELPGKYIICGQNIDYGVEWGIMYKSGSYWIYRIKINGREGMMDKTTWLFDNPRRCINTFEKLMIKYSLNVNKYPSNVPEQDIMYFL